MSNSNLRAFSRNVIVRPREESKVSPTGLHIVTEEKEAIMFADVISVGPDVTQDIKVGDVVVFDYWSGAEYEEFVILASELIFAVVEGV